MVIESTVKLIKQAKEKGYNHLVLEDLELIALHSYLYTHSHDEIYNRFKDNLGFLRHLVELGICDNLGRFSEQMEEAHREIEAILDKI